MQEIDKKLRALVRKYKKLSSAAPAPGKHRQTEEELATIRKLQDHLLDERIDLMQLAQLEDQFA